MARPAQDKKTFIEALEKSMGIITTACKKSGIPRRTVYNWLKDDREFSEAVREIEEVTLDFAESKLLKQIQAENITAIIFYLKTKGKKRGYVERQEVATVSDMTDDQVDRFIARAINQLENE